MLLNIKACYEGISTVVLFICVLLISGYDCPLFDGVYEYDECTYNIQN